MLIEYLLISVIILVICWTTLEQRRERLIREKFIREDAQSRNERSQKVVEEKNEVTSLEAEQRRLAELEEYHNSDEYLKKLYTQEFVLRVKEGFEEQISTYDPTPDEVWIGEWYIYTYVISPCFQELSARYRYDEHVSFNLKKDFLRYIAILRNEPSLLFMATDGTDEGGSWESSLDRDTAMKIHLENSFVLLLGDGFREKLDAARKMKITELWKYRETRYRE